MLASCCGYSACYDCLKVFLADQLNKNGKLVCPFCGLDWPTPASMLVANRELHKFLEQELIKDLNRLTAEEKE